MGSFSIFDVSIFSNYINTHFGFAILLSSYTDTLNKNISNFLHVCKIQCVKREMRKILRSCTKFGVKAASYELLTAQVGLQIGDDIINNAVTLLLSLKLP